jgi:HK97 gp10 family phage protein
MTIPQYQSALDKSMDKLVFKTANRIRNKAIELVLRGTKSGRRYRRRGVIHQASAPGEAPASDTGRLVQSIRVKHEPGSKRAIVVASTRYAVDLEFGTRHMAARPFLRPAVQAIEREGIAKGFKIEIGGT